MSKFFFAIAEYEIYRRILTLGSGTFYLHILAAVPSVDAETVQELTLAVPQPKILTGLLYEPNQIWTFADPIFANPTNFSVPVVGVVVCKMVGSVSAITDRLICFSSIAIPAGDYDFQYKFPATGLMEFGTLPIGILDLQFNEPNGSGTFIDRFNHRFKRFGSPVIASNGSAVFDGGGMLIAPVVIDRTANPTGLDSIAIFTAIDNDNFVNRQVLTGTQIRATGSNFGTTGEVGEPVHINSTSAPTNSIWWSWTAPETAVFIIDTIGSPLEDTILAVYTGNSVTALTQVITSQDISNTDLHSKVRLNATAGTIYQIAIDGAGSTTGGVVLNINRSHLTEWDFESNTSPQNLTFSIKFKFDVAGTTYDGHQYLFDSRHEDYFSNLFASHFAVRYTYSSADPQASYLAFEYREFQRDLGPNEYYPEDGRMPFTPIAEVEYRIDLVLFTDRYNDARPLIFIDGCYYSDNFAYLEWRLDKFAIGGTLYTNSTYPNIGDYPGYFRGSIDFVKMLQGTSNPVTAFAHPLTRVLDLPFSTDFKDIAPWDCTVTPVGSVSIAQGGGANFAGGYLKLDANKTTLPDDFDWQITLEITVPPNQAQDAIIFARLPDRQTIKSHQGNFFGAEMTLVVNPKTDENQAENVGRLALIPSFWVDKDKYDTVSSNGMRSNNRIDDGLPHIIVIQRTNGCKNHAHSNVVSGQPPAFGGEDGFNVINLYVDDRLQDQSFGANRSRVEEKADFENQPIYLGGLPAEITPANSTNTTNNRFSGSIGYFNFDNHLPSVPRLLEMEFDERDGSTTPLDLAVHTYTNVGSVTVNNKKAVFNGSNYLIANPVANEWNIDNSISDQHYTISVEWQFDNLTSPRPYQYIFDSRTANGTTNIVSLAYHHDSVPEGSFLRVSVNNYEADISIPFHAVVGTKYRCDILLWKAAGQIRSCVFFNGAYYQENLLAGNQYNWVIDRMSIGGTLYTNAQYPNPGDYIDRLQGKIERVKWVYGAFDPITRYAYPLTTVLDLEFEANFNDSSAYAHTVTSVGSITLLNRNANFNVYSGDRGYLIVSNNSVLNFGLDWRLDILVEPSYVTETNGAIVCRPELNSNNGSGFLLTYSDRDYPGYVVFRNQLSVNTTTNTYTTGAGTRPLLLSKKPAQNSGLTQIISIVRTTGILDRNTYQALWMFVNGVFQDVSFTTQATTSPNTPIYIGSLPPGLTSSEGFAVGDGKFSGGIHYVRLQNAIA